MTEEEVGRLIYLSLLGLFLLGSMFGLGAVGLAKTLRHILVWVSIFVFAILAYGQRDVFMREVLPERAQLPQISGGPQGRQITLRRGPGGGFRTQLQINGATVAFLVDTGATDVVLTQADARRIGLQPEQLNYSRRARTANGTVGIAPVRLDRVVFGGREDRNVSASVNQGELGISLLGMSYLRRFRSIEIQGNRMILIR